MRMIVNQEHAGRRYPRRGFSWEGRASAGLSGLLTPLAALPGLPARRPLPCVLPRTRVRDGLLPRDLARERRQVAQRAAIDAALEGHHVLQRVPEVHPAPEVELGLVGGVQAQVAFGAENGSASCRERGCQDV